MLIQLGKALTKVDFLKSQWVIGFTCIRSHHFMGNRWGISGNSDRLYFFGSNITVGGDCSHEIKRCLLLGRKWINNSLQTKVHLVKATVFPLVIYGCESWTIKKAEHQRFDAFELGVEEDS